MRNLIDFILNHYNWLIFLLLEVVSLTLLFNFNSYQGSVAFTSANSMAGAVYEGQSDVTSFFALKKVNEELTARNTELQHQVLLLTEELERQKVTGKRIEQVLKERNFRIIRAKVVQNSVAKTENLLTIDRGSVDGIEKDMGVVSGNGIVGIVYMVGSHYSVVLPALSTLSSISCKIAGTGYFGHLQWNGGSSHYAYVDDVPRHAKFKINQLVVTSGYSAVFPSGIPVGRIKSFEDTPDGVSYRLTIELSTDFSNLRDVSIIDNKRTHEQLKLLRQAEDSLELVKH